MSSFHDFWRTTCNGGSAPPATYPGVSRALLVLLNGILAVLVLVLKNGIAVGGATLSSVAACIAFITLVPFIAFIAFAAFIAFIALVE